MRIKGLDFLRAIAILLVLFRHSFMDDNNPVKFFGWLGVDLFFVLSGFLVTGLLLQEYQKHGKVNVRKFLVRRSFKIFPPFYFFMLFAVLYDYFVDGNNYGARNILSELFYVQNYAGHVRSHTWSLAVEEQFYLTLALAVFLVLRFRVLAKKRLVIIGLCALLMLSFVMRMIVSYPHRLDDFFGFRATHLRADGILTGVLIAILYHATGFKNLIAKRTWLFAAGAVLLIAPAFYFKGGSFFMNTFGLTMVNIGFGLIILLTLHFENLYQGKMPKLLSCIVAGFCFMGVHSYSIYLWHLETDTFINRQFHFSNGMMTLVYVLLSIAVGIAMSYLIEKQFLKLREKEWVKRFYAE